MKSLAAIASSQIGVQEIPRGSNTGISVRMYQRATDLTGTGWPWCAAFVSWCVQQWFTAYSLQPSAFTPPRLSRAYDFPKWGKANRCLVFAPGTVMAEPNDIAVYQFSHCGIVIEVKGNGKFEAVEGNTNRDGSRDGYEVARRPRTYEQTLAFIRLPKPTGEIS